MSALIACAACDRQELTKDEIGICRKLLGDPPQQYFCLACLADFLGCETGDILDKIEQFKEEGCKLFG